MPEPIAKMMRCNATKILHEYRGCKLGMANVYITTNTKRINFCPLCGDKLEREDKTPRPKRK